MTAFSRYYNSVVVAMIRVPFVVKGGVLFSCRVMGDVE